MKKQTFNPMGFIIFIISFFWFRISASHLISFRLDHEQVLLYTKEYLLEYFSSYGGISELFAQFVSQFYINPWLGSLILSLLVSTLVYRSFYLSRNNATPGILLWVLSLALFSLTEGALVHIVAFSMILNAFNDQEKLEGNIQLWLSRFIVLPILIFAAGSWVWLYVIMIIFRDAFGERKFSGTLHFFIGYAAVLGLIAQRFIWTMGIKDMLFGTLPFDSAWGIAFFVIGIGVLLFDRLPKKEYSGLHALNAFATLLLFVLITIINLSDGERTTERWRAYIKNDNYKKIIQEAEKRSPENKIQTLYMNYALAKENRLLDDMFTFPQAYGPDGLLPNPYEIVKHRKIREFPFLGDLYFEIGYFDKAHRIASDGIVFNGISPIYTKLKIKCLLAEGYFQSADKYLYLLEHTLFHRKWAMKYRNAIIDPVAYKNEFSKQRKYSPKQDRVISYDPANNLLTLLEQNPLNAIAFNYLCAYNLLQKQPAFLVDNVWVLGELKHKTLPKHYQEALLIYQLGYPNERIDLEGVRPDQKTIKRFYDFGAKFSQDKQAILSNYEESFEGMYLLYWFFTQKSKDTK